MPRSASRRRRWWIPTTSWSSASPSSTNRSAPRRSPSSISRAARLYVGVLGNERLRVLPIWELEFSIRHRARGPSPPRRSSTIPTIRNAAASCMGRPRDLAPELRARIPRHSQAHLPHPGTRRLCPHRFPPLGRRHPVLHRSQSQSRDRPDRRSSPTPPRMTASNTPTCSIGSWRSASAGRARPGSGAEMRGIKRLASVTAA